MNGIRVNEVRIAQPPPTGIAAFAIDSPRRGDETHGEGIEVTGWVIGGQMPVQGVRTVVDDRRSRVYPLDILRPDVAADYPSLSRAGSSGFTAWAPIDTPAGNWQAAVDALLADGSTRTLAEISGETVVTLYRDGDPPIAAPDFVIIGAQRGGTTSLHAWLSAHPAVKTPATKELHFLTDRHERGRDWYLGQYPLVSRYAEIAGEATPYALFHPLAPGRLWEIAPHAKLIALLRNPVDRAYSHYLLEVARGFEPLDFAAALDAEVERLTGEEARLMADPSYVSEPHKHFSYLARGDYAPQLERWLAAFPGEQLLVLRSEDLYQHPAATFAQVAVFLGIAPDLNIPFAVHNRSAGSPLDPILRARLAGHFAPRNANLASLLGWDLDWQ